jgi:hypothetical protein
MSDGGPGAGPSGGGFGYGPTPYGGYGAPQPGVVPLRPLALGEIFSGALATMRRHPGATLGLAGLVVLAQTVLGVAVDAALGGLPGTHPGLGAQDALAVVGEVINAALSALLLGMLIVVVVDAAVGRPATVRAAWARVRPRFWRLFGAALLAGLLPWLGLIGLIVLGVYLWAALAFAPAVVVVEDAPIGQSLRRSMALVRHSWWRVFGIYLLATLLAGAVASLIAAPGGAALGGFALHSAQHGSGTTVTVGAYTAAVVLGMIGRIVTAPFVTCVLGLLYLDRRIRTERFDPSAAMG